MLTNEQLYLLIPSFITAVVGSMVQFVYKDEQSKIPTSARVASTVGGLTLSVLFAAILLTVVNWNVLVVAFLAFLGGLVLEKAVRLFIDYMRASKDVVDFIERGKKVRDAAKDVTPENSQNPPKPE